MGKRVRPDPGRVPDTGAEVVPPSQVGPESEIASFTEQGIPAGLSAQTEASSPNTAEYMVRASEHATSLGINPETVIIQAPAPSRSLPRVAQTRTQSPKQSLRLSSIPPSAPLTGGLLRVSCPPRSGRVGGAWQPASRRTPRSCTGRSRARKRDRKSVV